MKSPHVNRGSPGSASRPDAIYHAHLIFRAQAAGAGKTYTTLIQSFGNLPPAALAIGEKALQVHRLPDRSRFDVRGIKPPNEGVPRASEFPAVDQEAAQPVRR